MATPQSKIQKRLHTVAEYLEFERQAEDRHAFVDGEIRAMAGESPWHSIIRVNLTREVSAQLKGKPCIALSSNMKTCSGEQVDPGSLKGLFSYADLTVVCGKPVFHDKFGDVLLNPRVIFEVLSPSTESFDRGEKFERYRIYNESLTDYVLVSQKKPLIEHFQRQPNGQWLMTEVRGMEGELHIASIDCHLKLAEVYDRVEFPSEKPAEESGEEPDEEPGEESGQ
ncbi:MAG: Uma2 family endonuclease [Blastocatellales bacterium]